METKRKIKWWKVVLLALVGGFFLIEFVGSFFFLADSFRAFRHDARYSPDFFSNSASMYYGNLFAVLVFGALLGFTAYALYRCFRPAALPRTDVGILLRRWRVLGLVCLAAFGVISVLIYLNIHAPHELSTGVANGGVCTTAGELAYSGRLLNGAALALIGAALSLARGGELKKLKKTAENREENGHETGI